MACLPRRALVAGALLLAVGIGPAAGARLPARESLTVPELLVLARKDNRSLQAARYAIDISRARLEQAGLRANPRLEVGVRSDLLFGNEGEYEGSIGLSQDFPVAGRLLRQKDLARVDVALAEAEVEDAERRQDGEVAAAAYHLPVIDRRIAALDKLIAAQQGLADTVRKRFRAAEVSEMDVNTVQIEVQRLRQEKLALQAEGQSLAALLNGLLGRPAAAPLHVELGAEAAPASPAMSLARLQSLALDRRADWHKALLSIDRAAAELALARSQRWEDWTLAVGLAQDRQVITGAPPQEPGRTIGISVSVPLPLFNKGQGRIAEAQSSAAQARAELEALRLAIGNEVALAFGQSQSLQAALAQLQAATFPLTARNVELARLGYSMGLLPVYEVVQAQRQAAEANTRYLDLLDQTLQARVRLHSAIGDQLTRNASATPGRNP